MAGVHVLQRGGTAEWKMDWGPAGVHVLQRGGTAEGRLDWGLAGDYKLQLRMRDWTWHLVWGWLGLRGSC